MRHRFTRLAAAVAVIGAVGSTAPAAASADWPVYGHDLANSRNAGTAGPPAAQVGSLPRAWTFRSQTGDFTGTPVVADGVVVAGDHGGTVHAIDAVSGKELWSKELGAPVNGTAAIDLDAPGGAAVYVPVAQPGSPHLVALSLPDGATRWDTTLTKQENASVYGSPTFSKGSVYIGTSGPNNDDTRARGSVVALDEGTGKIRWQTFTVPEGRDGAAVWTTPAIDEATGRMYVGTGNNYHQPTTDTEDAILALDTSDGGIVGKYQATADDAFAADNPAGPDFDFGASPNLFDGPNGQKLVGAGQKSGIYWALDRGSMQPVWQTMVGPGGILGGILGSTAVDESRIYGADTIDGQVFALGRDGSMTWESPDTGAAHLSPASIANGVLYTTDPSGSLNARDPATGSILAKLPLDGPAFGGVSATGGALFVSVGTGPPPEPGPQNPSPGSIVAFGDTSKAGGSHGVAGGGGQGPAARLRLSARPRVVRRGRLVRLRLRATRGGRPLAGAEIHLAGRRPRTGSDGRVTMRVRFRRAGRHVVRASKRGVGRASATVRAR